MISKITAIQVPSLFPGGEGLLSHNVIDIPISRNQAKKSLKNPPTVIQYSPLKVKRSQNPANQIYTYRPRLFHGRIPGYKKCLRDVSKATAISIWSPGNRAQRYQENDSQQIHGRDKVRFSRHRELEGSEDSFAQHPGRI